MATGKDKPDEGAAGPETSLSPINNGRAWEALERQGLNAPRDNPVDDYQRARGKAAVAKLLNEPDSAEREASASATTARHEDIDPEIVERFRRALEAQDAQDTAFALALCGELPDWVHGETWRQVCNAYHDLAEMGFKDDQILGFVARAHDCFVPGLATDSVAFLRAVDYLALVRSAVSLDPEKGLGMLYGLDASRGYRSREGSKQPRGPRWYTEPLRRFVTDMASRCKKQPPTLAEWVAAAREYCENQIWTQDNVSFEPSTRESKKTGEREAVVIAQMSGPGGETLKSKTLTLKRIYEHLPKFPG